MSDKQTIEIIPTVLAILESCRPEVFIGPIEHRVSHVAPHAPPAWIFQMIIRKGSEYPMGTEWGARKRKDAEWLRKHLYDELSKRPFAPAFCSTHNHLVGAVRAAWPEVALMTMPTSSTVQ